MTTTRREFAAVARLELAEVLRSRSLVFTVALEAFLAAVFVLVGLRESTVLGFTGIGRVLLSFSHALVLLLPLLALSATGQAINRARDDGTLELLFSHPVRRSAYFAAVSLTRLGALVLPLAVLLLGLGLVGRVAFAEPVPWRYLLRAIAVSASLLSAYVGLGLLVSTLVRHQARALVYLLLVWTLSVALVDFALIGLLLRWHLTPQAVFLLAALNPVEAARLALLSGVDADLAALGPVGFYLAHRLGDRALFAVGLAWPAIVGLVAWGLALRSFRRHDLV